MFTVFAGPVPMPVDAGDVVLSQYPFTRMAKLSSDMHDNLVDHGKENLITLIRFSFSDGGQKGSTILVLSVRL